MNTYFRNNEFGRRYPLPRALPIYVGTNTPRSQKSRTPNALVCTRDAKTDDSPAFLFIITDIRHGRFLKMNFISFFILCFPRRTLSSSTFLTFQSRSFRWERALFVTGFEKSRGPSSAAT